MNKSLWATCLIGIFLSSIALAGTTHFARAASLVSVSITPASTSVNVGDRVQFTSTLTGATIPYWYAWFLNGTTVSNSASWTFWPPTRGTYSVYLKVYPSVNNSAYDVAQSETSRVVVGGQAFIGVFGNTNGSSQASGGTQYDAFGSRFTLSVEANVTSMSCLMSYQSIPCDLTRNYSYAFAIYRDNNGTVGSLVAQTVQGTMLYYENITPLWYTLDFPSVVHLAPAAYWLMEVNNASGNIMVTSDVQPGYESVTSFIYGTTFPRSMPSPIHTHNYVFSICASRAVNFSASLSEDNNDFSIASNSTVSSLDYNSNSNEVRFNVSGSSGTTGYTEAFISKTMLPDVAAANVTLDGQEISFATTSVGDSWVLYFGYPHSTHNVAIRMQPNMVPEFPTPFLIIPLIMINVLVLFYFKKRKH